MKNKFRPPLRYVSIFLLLCVSVGSHSRSPSTHLKTYEPDIELVGFSRAIADYLSVEFKSFIVDNIDINDINEYFSKNFQKEIKKNMDFLNYQVTMKNLPKRLRKSVETCVTKRKNYGLKWSVLHHRAYKNSYFVTYVSRTHSVPIYLELKLKKKNDGWKVTDCYDYLLDFWASDGIKQSLQSNIRHKSFKGFTTYTSTLRKFQLAGDRKAIEYFESLDNELKKDRAVQLAFASNIGPDNEGSFIEGMKLLIPYLEVDTLGIIQLFYYHLTDNPDQVIRQIKQIDMKVGGDPILSMVKVEMHLKMGRKEQAIESLINLLKNVGPLTKKETYTRVFLFLVENQWYDSAVLAFELLAKDDDFIFDIDSVSSMKELQSFIESKHYRKWLENLEKR